MIIKSKSQSTGKFCDLKKQFLLSKVNKVQFPSSLFTYCGPFTLILCTYHIKDRDFQYVLLLCESESFITLILWYEIYLVYSCFFDSYSYLLGEVFPDSLKKTNWLEIPNNVSINTFLNFFIFYTTYDTQIFLSFCMILYYVVASEAYIQTFELFIPRG